jgi:hypothetical protein
MAVTFVALSGILAGTGLAQVTKTTSGKCHLCQTHHSQKTLHNANHIAISIENYCNQSQVTLNFFVGLRLASIELFYSRHGPVKTKIYVQQIAGLPRCKKCGDFFERGALCVRDCFSWLLGFAQYL